MIANELTYFKSIFLYTTHVCKVRIALDVESNQLQTDSHGNDVILLQH